MTVVKPATVTASEVPPRLEEGHGSCCSSGQDLHSASPAHIPSLSVADPKRAAGARAQAVQTMLDSQPEQLVTWVLYSFAYVPLSQVDITIAPIATELQARTLNTSYVLSAQGMPPSLVSVPGSWQCI